MPKGSGKCFEWLDGSRITTPAESGKSVTFLNQRGEKVLLVHADRFCRKGKLGDAENFLEVNQKVADYIVCKPQLVDVVVELKGVQIMEAIAQIEETISVWKKHPTCSGKLGALVVSSKGGNHPTVQSKLEVKQAKFRRSGITLKHIAAPNPELEFSDFA